MSTIPSPETPPSPASEDVLPSGNLTVPAINRRRGLIATVPQAVLRHGLLALLLPLGLLFLALVAHG